MEQRGCYFPGRQSLRHVTYAALLGMAGVLAGCSGASMTAAGAAARTPQVLIAGPATAYLGAPVQITASVSGTDTQALTWAVNGVPGGSSSFGTITAMGVYTPPSNMPSQNAVTITAMSQAVGSASASLVTTLLSPPFAASSATLTLANTPTRYVLDVQGSGFTTKSQLVVGSAAVTTTFVSATELKATVPLPATATSLPVSVNSGDGSGTVTPTMQATAGLASLAAAARLLDQATFGESLSDIQHVQQVGLAAFLKEQFGQPATLLPAIANPPPALCVNSTLNCEQSEWWQAALTGPDQLRQRVALALSEIFVVSTNSVNPRSVTPYQNILATDAFGNFRDLMKDVTLSPAMGAYLNMLQSRKPGNGQIANENYGRELMQLFTIGLEQLNQNGTVKLDANGAPIPAYTEKQVEAFARAFTGWTYALPSGAAPTTFPNNTANFDVPMAAVESAHDMTSKALLDGTVLPSGQSSLQDLNGALDNLFQNANVGPFVCRQLIQHLVTSNPSTAYVGRVAAIFANNGSGVRGDMQAVITAILSDPQARGGDTDTTFNAGHLREPLLYIAEIMRALGFTNTDANGYFYYPSNYTAALGERPYASPSVFNFFSPEYVIPGTTLNAPEFGQENTAAAILRLTLDDNLVFNRISGFKVDLTATGPLGKVASATGVAATDSANLVDTLSALFMHGLMPAQMRTAIINHVTTLTNIPQRVRVATYLVISSSQYKIQH